MNHNFSKNDGKAAAKTSGVFLKSKKLTVCEMLDFCLVLCTAPRTKGIIYVNIQGVQNNLLGLNDTMKMCSKRYRKWPHGRLALSTFTFSYLT